MPPNSTVTIVYRYTLEPGVTAGQVITNTMGASSPVANLACTPPDAVVTDGAFGAGTYCTDPANVTVTAGANFVSRKWVAGNPDLGWYNVLTGERVDDRRVELLGARAPTDGRTPPIRASPWSTPARSSTTCCASRTPAPRARWR